MSSENATAAAAALAAAVSSPVEVSGDAGSVRMPSIPDLLAAENRALSKLAARSPRQGARITQLVPGGTT